MKNQIKKIIILLIIILAAIFEKWLYLHLFPLLAKINRKKKRKKELCIRLTEHNNLTVNLIKYIRLDNDYRNNGNKFFKNKINIKEKSKLYQKNIEIRNYNKGISMCLVIKNQFQYVKDFIEFYKNMGVKKIFLYDNSEIDAEEYKFKLNQEIKNSFVEVINIRGYCAMQLIAYNHCYDTNKQNFDWFIFFDTDEYIFIEKNKTLIDYLYDEKFRHCKYIKLNLRFYTDNDMLYYSNKSVVERFTVSSSFQLLSPKSIIRGGLKDKFIMTAHFPIFINNCCNSEGGIENPNSFIISKHFYNRVYLRHYFTKSTAEFCDKINLGSVYRGRYRVKSLINTYYFINNLTNAKRKMLAKCLIKSGFREEIKYLYWNKKQIYQNKILYLRKHFSSN